MRLKDFILGDLALVVVGRGKFGALLPEGRMFESHRMEDSRKIKV